MLRLRSVRAALVAIFAALGLAPASAAPPDSAVVRPAAKSSAQSAAPIRGGAAVSNNLAPAPSRQSDASLLGATTAERQLVVQLIQAEVEAALVRGRQKLAIDPAAVTQELKLLLQCVLAAPELSSAERGSLRGRLEVALRQANARETQLERTRIDELQRGASAEERARVALAFGNQQERRKQLLERFDSLLAEGRYDLAREAASQADLDGQRDGDNVLGTSALMNVTLASATRDQLAMRNQRQEGVARSLAQSELASVPLAGEEPIIYPQDWQELTLRRPKYARTDLYRSTPSEARVQKALGETTNFDFVEISLADAVAYLKDLHGIEIQFDRKALEEDSIDVDVLITRRLSGISLRSALRLLLGALDLTYTIDNEVLLITTPNQAMTRLTTKVYPVGELVMPIVTPTINRGFGQPMGLGSQGGGQQNPGMNQLNQPGQNQNGGPPF